MKKFYNLVSLIFQPLLMPTYGMIMFVNVSIFDGFSGLWRFVAVTGTFLFTGLLPAIPILLLIKKGEVHDLFISRREERTVPYLFSLLSYIFWTVFLWKMLNFPLFMIGTSIGTSFSIFLIILINLKWKISAHMSGIGGLAGATFGFCYRLAFNPLLLFIIILALAALIALSRIELKAHTPGQTLAGFTLSFLCVFLPCILL